MSDAALIAAASSTLESGYAANDAGNTTELAKATGRAGEALVHGLLLAQCDQANVQFCRDNCRTHRPSGSSVQLLSSSLYLLAYADVKTAANVIAALHVLSSLRTTASVRTSFREAWACTSPSACCTPIRRYGGRTLTSSGQRDLQVCGSIMRCMWNDAMNSCC